LALGDEQTALSIQQSRLVASVTLIEALGGGWQAGDVPDVAAVKQNAPVAAWPVASP